MFIEEQNGLTLKNGLKKIYKNKRYSEMDTFFISIPEDSPAQITILFGQVLQSQTLLHNWNFSLPVKKY